MSLGRNIIGISLGLALLVTVLQLAALHQPSVGVPARISIEHTKPLRADIRFLITMPRNIVELTADPTAATTFTVPATWTRGEIRNGQLLNVVRTQTSDATVTWKVPTGATLSFSSPEAISFIDVQNPSTSPLSVRVTRVDTEKRVASFNAYLLKDEPLIIR